MVHYLQAAHRAHPVPLWCAQSAASFACAEPSLRRVQDLVKQYSEAVTVLIRNRAQQGQIDHTFHQFLTAIEKVRLRQILIIRLN